MRPDLGSQQWGRKKAAALAVAALAKSGAEALPPHTPALATALLAELPGRLWDGKEALLEALAALAAAAPAALGPPQGSPPPPAPSPAGSSGAPGAAAGPGEGAVVDALLAAAARKKSAYRAAALKALEITLGGLQGDHYAAVAPALLEAVAQHTPGASSQGAADDAQVRCACCCASCRQHAGFTCKPFWALISIFISPSVLRVSWGGAVGMRSLYSPLGATHWIPACPPPCPASGLTDNAERQRRGGQRGSCIAGTAARDRALPRGGLALRVRRKRRHARRCAGGHVGPCAEPWYLPGLMKRLQHMCRCMPILPSGCCVCSFSCATNPFSMLPSLAFSACRASSHCHGRHAHGGNA